MSRTANSLTGDTELPILLQIKIENNSITDLILHRPTTYGGRTRSEVQTTSNHVRETKNQKEPIGKQLRTTRVKA